MVTDDTDVLDRPNQVTIGQRAAQGALPRSPTERQLGDAGGECLVGRAGGGQPCRGLSLRPMRPRGDRSWSDLRLPGGLVGDGLGDGLADYHVA
jgi:hypothetical protein